MELLYIWGCLKKKSKLLNFKIREFIIILGLLNDLKWKFINYNILRLVILYNFDIKLTSSEIIWISYEIIFVGPLGAGNAIIRL